MSMNDYVWEPGIEKVIEGEGYSLWHEPTTGKWRADVIGAEEQRAVPLTGDMTMHRAMSILERLVADFDEQKMPRTGEVWQQLDPVGLKRAKALPSAMEARFG